ncbi:hypothetical protein EWB00_009899 [Schistosoma japonicum]|uniref:Trematode Eggshell Synthesis,domain-containing protein n=1 Tax=Schistosoma japonicum TaxID=6182 RepID=A0A4Z2CL94_SCHJA|nr:hypothetical protein EWB00_009899 [Schistosoma japonicum]
MTVTIIFLEDSKAQGQLPPFGQNSSFGSSFESSDQSNRGSRGQSHDKRDSSKHAKNGIALETMSGTSTSRYQYRKMKDFKARGKSRSRGIGRYGIMSSESTDFVVEGKIGEYGHRKPMKSKFKTRGKEKKYSRKISDNRFDIKGDLYARHQHEGIGDYQASGNYTTLNLKTKERNGQSNRNKQNSEFKSHNNHSNENANHRWVIF